MSQKQFSKKRKWPWVLGVLTLIIIAGVIFLPSLMPSLPASNVDSVAVIKGSIAETVVGTGRLESGSGEETEVKIPVDVKVDTVYVESDDEVTKGDILATIDPLSLRQRIASIRSEINHWTQE